MLEYFTEALVLDKQDLGEADGLVHLYTEELGRLSAKARSIKKITSKSSAHLEPVHFVKVRFILGKNGSFQVIDSLSFEKGLKKKIKNCPEKLAKFLRISNFIKEMSPELQSDQNLWQAIKNIFHSDIEERSAYGLILKELGLDPQYAVCNICGADNINFFYKTDQSFFCDKCVPAQKVFSKSLVKII